MILNGALELPARVLVIGDATVGFGQPELPGFVARIEAQRFVVGGNGAGKILSGGEGVAQIDAQAHPAGFELDRTSEFVGGRIPVLFRHGFLRQLFELGGRHRLRPRRRLHRSRKVNKEEEAQKHG